MNSFIQVTSWIVPQLFFLEDGFGIKWPTKIDMSLNKEIKPKKINNLMPALCVSMRLWGYNK